jgi:hypothetical protein
MWVGVVAKHDFESEAVFMKVMEKGQKVREGIGLECSGVLTVI